MGMRHRHAARRLLSLLEQERQALASGNLPAAAALAPTLQRQAETLEGLGRIDDRAFGALMARVSAAAERNCALARASERGLRTAERLLSEIHGARSRLATYTGRGERREISTDRASADRRF